MAMHSRTKGCAAFLCCLALLLVWPAMAQPATPEFVGPPCTSGCLFAVQGNLTLQEIATTTETTFAQLVALNDVKYVSGQPSLVYQQPTICVSADYCIDENLMVDLEISRPRTCDSECRIISQPSYNKSFAIVAKEISSAIINRNSKAAAIAPFDLLASNPASKYAGAFQSLPTIVCAPYTACRPKLECIVPIDPAADAGELSAYTSTPLNQLSYLNQDFTARAQAKALGQSLCVLEDCDYQEEDCITGCAVSLTHNTTYRQLAKSLPFQQEPDQQYDSSGHPYYDVTSTFDSILDFLNSPYDTPVGAGKLQPYLPRYPAGGHGNVDAVLPFQSLCLPRTFCRRCTQVPRVTVNGTKSTASRISRGSAEPSVPAFRA